MTKQYIQLTFKSYPRDTFMFILSIFKKFFKLLVQLYNVYLSYLSTTFPDSYL